MRSRLSTILLIALLGTAPYAGAAEGGDFTIAPVRPQTKDPRDQSYFVYTADPGQVIEDQFQVTNPPNAAPASAALRSAWRGTLLGCSSTALPLPMNATCAIASGSSP